MTVKLCINESFLYTGKFVACCGQDQLCVQVFFVCQCSSLVVVAAVVVVDVDVDVVTFLLLVSDLMGANCTRFTQLRVSKIKNKQTEYRGYFVTGLVLAFVVDLLTVDCWQANKSLA